MPSRLLDQSKRKVPYLNFKIPFYIYLPFSICGELNIQEEFARLVGNENKRVPKVVKAFCYKKWGINNETELITIPEVNKKAEELKEVLYSRFGVIPMRKSFSDIIMEELIKESIKKKKVAV